MEAVGLRRSAALLVTLEIALRSFYANDSIPAIGSPKCFVLSPNGGSE